MSAGLTVLLVVGLAVPTGSLLMAAFRHFRGRGPSPGSIGSSLALLVVLFSQSQWPLWLRLGLAPIVVALEFSWLALYWVLERLFPRKDRSTDA
jgi:hypothetical protein